MQPEKQFNYCIWDLENLCVIVEKFAFTYHCYAISFPSRNFPFLIRIAESCNLDFFFGFLKFEVYADKPTTIYTLKEKMKRYINEIQPFIQNDHGKFQQKSAYVPAKRWRPFNRYAIPYIILYCIFHESIKNL